MITKSAERPRRLSPESVALDPTFRPRALSHEDRQDEEVMRWHNGFAIRAVICAREGEYEYLVELFNCSWKTSSIRKLCKYGLDRDRAEDYIQSMWVKALPSIKNFTLQSGAEFSSLGRWFSRILTNMVIDASRTHEGKHPLVSIDDMADKGHELASELAMEDRLGELSALVMDELIHRTLMTLSVDDQQIIKMYFFEGRAYSEITQLLNKASLGASRTMVSRAVKLIRQNLRETGAWQEAADLLN